jgi:2-polyprenyl-3-methyl-5-hydroxy-6-metoxy-1,4-benzoquinol methylase
MSDPGPFEQSYWTADSQYRKFEDYAAALAALRIWYQGLFRLIGADLPKPGRALDAGCGHGAIVYELLDRGWDAHGFDASHWLIEQARAFNSEAAERFEVGELPAVPIQGSFDLITCIEVLEHVSEPLAVLRAFRGRLRPGGLLIATSPNLRPLIPWWDAAKSDPTHVSVHEAAWWRDALETAGLEVRRVTTFVALPVLWRVHPLFARWIRLGRRAGPGVLMVADRPGTDAA